MYEVKNCWLQKHEWKFFSACPNSVGWILCSAQYFTRAATLLKFGESIAVYINVASLNMHWEKFLWLNFLLALVLKIGYCLQAFHGRNSDFVVIFIEEFPGLHLAKNLMESNASGPHLMAEMPFAEVFMPFIKLGFAQLPVHPEF